MVSVLQKSSRNWCFTVNNYDDDIIEHINDIDCKYLLYGKEIAPTTGTPHLQGFIVFNSAKSGNAVKTLFRCNPHLEPTHFAEAYAKYCEKDGDIFEKGERPITQAGKGAKEKVRWDLVMDAAKHGRFDEIPDDIMYRNPRAPEIIRNRFLSERQLEPVYTKHVWVYGPTGTGKTTYVYQKYPGAFYKRATKWFDGYKDQDTVVIDDLDYRHEYMAYDLKLWAGEIPFMAETKGGSRMIRPKLFVITSNCHPNQIWCRDEDLKPILRRFEFILMDVPIQPEA